MRELTFTPSGLAGLGECPRAAIAKRNMAALVSAGYKLLPDKKSIAAVAGTLLHEAVALAPSERQGWIDDDMLPGGKIGMKPMLDAEIERAVEQNGTFEWDTATPAFEELGNQLLEMALAVDEATHNVLWDKSDSGFQCEQKVEAVVNKAIGIADPKLKIILRGRYDFFDPENGILYDVKTSKRDAPNDAGLQLAAYYALIKSTGVHIQKRARIIHVVRHRYTARTPNQKKAVIVEYDLRPYLSQAISLLQEGVRFTQDFWSSDSFPQPNRVRANPKGMLCSPNFCRLYGTTACDATGKDVRQIFNNLEEIQ